MRIFNKSNRCNNKEKLEAKVTGLRTGQERNYPGSWSSLSHIDTGPKINDDQSSSPSSPHDSPGPVPRLNSIAELLEQFRKEEPSDKDDMKSIRTLPIYNSSSLTDSISSSSLSAASAASLSEVSSVTSSKDSKDSWKTCSKDTKDFGSKSPVDHWLSELPSLCESECSVMLQSKSLQGKSHQPVTNLAIEFLRLTSEST